MDECPITGIAFNKDEITQKSLIDSYERLAQNSSKETDHPFDEIYFTKSNFQNPITSFKISANLPCLNPDERDIDNKDVVYFAEVETHTQHCTKDSRYTELKLNDGF